MNVPRIIPIVEGYGEERAIPCLIRRWLQHRQWHRYFDVPDKAINAKGCSRLKSPYNRERHLGIEHYIQAALRGRPDAILVVLDADQECIQRDPGNGLGPELLARAKAVAPHVPLAVVVANPEYEVWFLASLTSIRASGLLPADSSRIPLDIADYESRSGCKGVIEKILRCPYEETVHQLMLTKGLTFSHRAGFRSPSYGKLLRDLERLVKETRSKPVN